MNNLIHEHVSYKLGQLAELLVERNVCLPGYWLNDHKGFFFCVWCVAFSIVSSHRATKT